MKVGSMVDDRLERLAAEQEAALAEIRRSRKTRGGQPTQALRRSAGSATKGLEDNKFWRTPGHFLKTVREIGSGHWSSHPEMKNYMTKALPSGMNETVGSDGGYLVPPEFVNQLLMRTYENDLLSRTTLFPMASSNMMRIPAVSETSRADGSQFGGVRAYWTSEAGTITPSKPAIDVVQLTPNELTLAVRATQQLLDDAPSLESWLDIVADQVMAFKIGDAIVNGDGVTKPKGLMNSPSKVTVSQESGQDAATILSENILSMWVRLHLSCRANAVWLIDQSVEEQLSLMTIGTAGAKLASYMPPGGLSDKPYATLMGKPVIVTEFGKQCGTEGDIILTDLSTYLTATRGGLETAVSMHVYFLSNEQVFRFVMRIDGRNWWISALTPKSGGNTQTNIVTLETRSG